MYRSWRGRADQLVRPVQREHAAGEPLLGVIAEGIAEADYEPVKVRAHCRHVVPADATPPTVLHLPEPEKQHHSIAARNSLRYPLERGRFHVDDAVVVQQSAATDVVLQPVDNIADAGAGLDVRVSGAPPIGIHVPPQRLDQFPICAGSSRGVVDIERVVVVPASIGGDQWIGVVDAGRHDVIALVLRVEPPESVGNGGRRVIAPLIAQWMDPHILALIEVGYAAQGVVRVSLALIVQGGAGVAAAGRFRRAARLRRGDRDAILDLGVDVAAGILAAVWLVLGRHVRAGEVLHFVPGTSVARRLPVSSDSQRADGDGVDVVGDEGRLIVQREFQAVLVRVFRWWQHLPQIAGLAPIEPGIAEADVEVGRVNARHGHIVPAQAHRLAGLLLPEAEEQDHVMAGPHVLFDPLEGRRLDVRDDIACAQALVGQVAVDGVNGIAESSANPPSAAALAVDVHAIGQVFHQLILRFHAIRMIDIAWVVVIPGAIGLHERVAVGHIRRRVGAGLEAGVVPPEGVGHGHCRIIGPLAGLRMAPERLLLIEVRHSIRRVVPISAGLPVHGWPDRTLPGLARSRGRCRGSLRRRLGGRRRGGRRRWGRGGARRSGGHGRGASRGCCRRWAG